MSFVQRSPPAVATSSGLGCPSDKLKAVTRKQNEILALLSDPSLADRERIRVLYEEYNQKLTTFVDACNEHTSLDRPVAEVKRFEEWYKDRIQVIKNFQDVVARYLSGGVSNLGQELSPTDSASQTGKESEITERSSTSKRSSSSSTSSARLKLAEKKAKLQAEKAFLEQEANLELQRRKLQLAKDEEEHRCLDEQLNKIDFGDGSHISQNNSKTPIPKSDFNPYSVSFVPSFAGNCNVDNKRKTEDKVLPDGGDIDEPGAFRSVNLHNSKGFLTDESNLGQFLSDQNRISLALIRNQENSLLPRVEPAVFDGSDILQFKTFICAFQQTIENRCQSDADKFYFLEKYTSGQPKTLVSSCNGGDPAAAYGCALQLLQSHYGNEYYIAQAYLEKLESWNQINNEDGKALQELSIFLTSCGNAMKGMDALNQLNSVGEIQRIVKKLPFDMRKKFRQSMASIIRSGGCVTFAHLEKFVSEQSFVLNLPILGQIKDNDGRTRGQTQLTQKKRSFAISSKSKTDSSGVSRPSEGGVGPLECPCCKKTHELNICWFFNKKTHEEKLESLKSWNLCYSCFQHGHRSKFCRNRLKCNKCNRTHPSSLHREGGALLKPSETGAADISSKSDAPETPSDATPSAGASATTSSGGAIEKRKVYAAQAHTISSNKTDECSRVVCAAVPIKIWVEKTKTFIKTYIGLDNFSNANFMDQQLADSLGVNGVKSNISLTTMECQNSIIESEVISNLKIFNLEGNISYVIPQIYIQQNWPFSIDDSPRRSDIRGHPHLENVPFEFIDKRIGMLIGINMPELLKPLETVEGGPNEIFASRHLLGWAISGPTFSNGTPNSSCHKIGLQNSKQIEEKIEQLYSQDFADSHLDETGWSYEDGLWLKKVQESIKKRIDGHYQIDLPFKQNDVIMPSNYRQVYCRLQSLKKRFENNPTFFEDYKNFIDDMITRNYMQVVPENEIEKPSGKIWFVTHHAVYHKKKKKIRVVFDCSLKSAGVSLNTELLQGPVLTSHLVPVLLRFREGLVAFSGDVEKMYFQVKVNDAHADFMRMLWFPDNDFARLPIQYRVNSHIFGAISSPSCANFALRQTALDCGEKYSKEAKDSISKNFYVDDLLKSVDSEEIAIFLVGEIRSILAEANFNLTGFVSSSRKVMSALQRDILSKNFKELQMDKDQLPTDRALGIRWIVENDSFGFKNDMDKKDFTKRGVLATVASIYDPLGLLGPVTVAARFIFQETCRLKLDWDQSLPEDLALLWRNWIEETALFESYHIPRCIRSFAGETQSQLHIFCDGSSKAYGAVAYARFENANGEVSCSIVMAKSRMNPIGNNTLRTIPRIELNAAKLAVEILQLLKKEMTVVFHQVFLWSDSLTVLKYISNETSRFQRFVANRVALIRATTLPEQWKFVPGELNIADVLSRGSSMTHFMNNETWKKGPQFLWHSADMWPLQPDQEQIPDSDLEIIKEKCAIATKLHDNCLIERLLLSTSDWHKLILRVAAVLHLKGCLKSKIWKKTLFLPSELHDAEISIWLFLQQKIYPTELMALKSSKQLKKNNALRKLNPIIDGKGLLRVGGRINKGNEGEETMHPIILPNSHHAVELLVRQCHKASGHMGRNYILSVLREKYWIVGGNSLARKVTRQCIGCQKRNGRFSQQMMADLPSERVIGGHRPFLHTGIDYFGPWLITKGRSRANEKRYGVVFSCLTSRAVHLEVAHSMDTTSFIDALRRFVARRGRVKSLISDNGTNFVGGCRELKEALNEWNSKPLHLWCQQQQIEWKFNPASASHFGGIYEREIRTVRKIINGLIEEQPRKLNDEALQTLMCEAESILNNRPLTSLSDDPADLRPLTPNHLLLVDPPSALPPGIFDKSDAYCRQRWKHVQYLVDVFWSRWRREYLRLLQERQKWHLPRRSHKIGDLVLVADCMFPRSSWAVGRVLEVTCDTKGLARAAKIRISRCKSGRDLSVSNSEITRPIAKLILLMPSEEN